MCIRNFEVFMLYDGYDDKSDWSDAECNIEQARDYYDRGCCREALHKIQAALEANPNNSNWLFNKGLVLDSLERYREALEAFEAARELEPHDPEILNCIGVDYTRLGRYDRALEIFEFLQEATPDYEPAYCNRIITYSEMGEHEKAEEMFYLAQQLRADCPLCYFNIGNSLFSRQLYDRAIWCWQQTRYYDSHHPMVDYRIAQAYWAQGDHTRAREYFLAELRRRPGDVEVLLDTGILLLEMNHLDSAREKFHRIVELDDAHSQAHHYLGEIFLHEGHLDQAVETFHRALALDPNQRGCHYRLGECYLRLGRPDDAREHLLAEIQFNCEDTEVLLNLGCLLEEVNETIEAIRSYERVIDMSPNDIRGYHNLSICFYRMGRLDEGIELSLGALDVNPEHVPSLVNLAYACQRKGDYATALDYAYQALERVDEPQIRRLVKSLKRSFFLSRTLQPIQRIIKRFR
ncbi:MAG: tetratricopeptide repeat protein [Sedimentisphaerales bacterium]|nr:tetratricopeptide repeat protein [Sedimentisphaerales bacterium]